MERIQDEGGSARGLGLLPEQEGREADGGPENAPAAPPPHEQLGITAQAVRLQGHSLAEGQKGERIRSHQSTKQVRTTAIYSATYYDKNSQMYNEEN